MKNKLVLLFLLLCLQQVMLGRTKIIFRYDDFSADPPEARKKNQIRREIWRVEQEIDTIFEHYGFPYVVSIVPEANPDEFQENYLGKAPFTSASDPEKVDFIKKGIAAGRIEIAQHGHSHVNRRLNPKESSGEFIGLDYASQYMFISQGRQILMDSCGVDSIPIFVPPWNQWTPETASVLKALDFKILSGDRNHCFEAANGLHVVPFTVQFARLEEVLDAGEIPEDGTLVVLFHVYNFIRLPRWFNTQYYGMERFESLLQRIKTSDFEVVGLSEFCSVEDCTYERYESCYKARKTRKLIVNILGEEPKFQSRDYFYLTKEQYERVFWERLFLLTTPLQVNRW